MSVRVLEIAVHNVMGVERLVLPTEGHNLILIGGANGAGKSSALDAVRMAICGLRSRGAYKCPPEPLRKGSTKGSVAIKAVADGKDAQNLGNDRFTIRRSWYRKGEKQIESLVIEDPDGIQSPEPQKLLDAMYRFSGIDPTAFLSGKPEEQRTILRKMVGLDDAEAALQTKRDEAFQNRTVTNRLVKQTEGALSQIPAVEGDPIDEEAIQAELNEAHATNERLNALRQAADSVRREYSVAKANADIASSTVAAAESRIESLRRQLADAEALLVTQKASEEACKAELSSAKVAVDSLREVPQNVDTAAINTRMTAARKHNKSLEGRSRRVELEYQLGQHRADSERLTKEIERIDAERESLAAGVKWPVDGLSVDEETVRYNGIPLEQCSTKERIRVSMEIGMHLDPSLKLIVIQRGESLSPESLNEIAAIAKERGYLVLMEYVCHSTEDEGRCQVVMFEGKDVKGSQV